MFQLGLDLETDTQITHWYVDVIRSVCALFDRIVYWLMMIVYEVFFNIADSTIISSETVKEFYARLQLIIGVFMIFKVSISLMQSVMNPDRLTDKDNGMGKIITRIITMLAMFTAIIPLNIPNAVEGSFNASLNENGLLFGTLYSLQSRVIGNNVLGKLIVGNVSTNESSDTSSDKIDESTGFDKEKSARQLATFVLKTFVRINLREGATEAGATDPSNYMCREGWGEDYDTWADEDSTPNDILDNINDWCSGPNGEDDNYSFVYTPIISTICGGVIVFVLLGFCIDIAIRALKLAVLRLLAPIPIISYIDPKSAKDGSFASWVKSLSSTYLDLFLRLAIIYFVLFLIQSWFEKGFSIPIGNGVIGLISTVFIIIGLFYFARMAPKFIKDALGMKGSMSNIGLTGMVAGAGALVKGGNIHDAYNASRDATDTQIAAYNQGKQAPGLWEGGYNVGADMMARELTGNDKMTAKQMRRGKKQLQREGLTNERVEAAKQEMYDRQDDATRAENLYQQYKDGNASEAQLRTYARQHNLQYDSHFQSFTDANGHSVGVRKALEDNAINTKTSAGKAESKYKDMDAEFNRFGGGRNGYRAKRGDLRDTHAGHRDARFSDLLTHEGREAMRTGSPRETLRNVRSMPQNRRLDRSDELNSRVDSDVETDIRIAGLTNERMNDSREQRNNGNNGNNGNP